VESWGFGWGGAAFFGNILLVCRTYYLLSLQVVFGYYEVLNGGWCCDLRRYPQSWRGHGGEESFDIPERFNREERRKERLELSLGSFWTAKAALDLVSLGKST